MNDSLPANTPEEESSVGQRNVTKSFQMSLESECVAFFGVNHLF